MRVSLFAQSYGRRHACITLSLWIRCVISASFIDWICFSSQRRYTSWTWLLMFALIGKLLQILIERFELNVVLTVFALFIIWMSTQVLVNDRSTFFGLWREASEAFHMWRMLAFYSVLSRTIFLLLHLGFVGLMFLLSADKTMNAHAFFVMVAFWSPEIHI